MKTKGYFKSMLALLLSCMWLFAFTGCFAVGVRPIYLRFSSKEKTEYPCSLFAAEEYIYTNKTPSFLPTP